MINKSDQAYKTIGEVVNILNSDEKSDIKIEINKTVTDK